MTKSLNDVAISLDFSVLVNSAVECGIMVLLGHELSQYADFGDGYVEDIANLLNQNEDAVSLAIERMKSAKAISKKENFRWFLDSRPFVVSAADYKTVMRMAESKNRPKKMNNELFKKEVQTETAEYRAAATREFYVARELCRSVDEAAWIELNQFYTGAKTFVKTIYQRAGPINIVTSKDFKSTFQLLKSASLDSYVGAICGNDCYKNLLEEEESLFERRLSNKGEQLRSVSEKSGIPLSKTAFLDDQRLNCQYAKEAGTLFVAAIDGGYDSYQNLIDGLEKREYDLVISGRRGEATAETFINGFRAKLASENH